MRQGELISIRPNLPCASSPIFLNGAASELPKWNTISISGYHIREAGSTAVQEIAFTLSNGKAYVKAALEKRIGHKCIWQSGYRSFSMSHNNLFEEVAKFRAARRMWAKMMKDLGATDPRAMMLRFHAQTGGSTLNSATTTQ